MRYLALIFLSIAAFAHEPVPFVPCTSAVLIIKHDYTPYCLTPEYRKEKEEVERIQKEESKKAAELEKKHKEEESAIADKAVADSKSKQQDNSPRPRIFNPALIPPSHIAR